jgi:hypothetical protein
MGRREDLIRDLLPEVNRAFDNRIRERFISGGLTTTEGQRLIKNQSVKYFKGRPDTDFVQLPPIVAAPHQVIVRNPDTFEVLVWLADTRLSIKDGIFVPDAEIRKYAAITRRHEEAHAAPYLEHPKTQIGYGISYVEDITTGKFGLKAFLALGGEVSVGARRRSLTAPDDISLLDRTAIRHSK